MNTDGVEVDEMVYITIEKRQKVGETSIHLAPKSTMIKEEAGKRKRRFAI